MKCEFEVLARMTKVKRYRPGYELPRRKPRRCTVDTTITRYCWRLWKPYTLSILIRGQWICKQAFWRRTDCERVQLTLKRVVNDWNRAHGYFSLESITVFPKNAYPFDPETV